MTTTDDKPADAPATDPIDVAAVNPVTWLRELPGELIRSPWTYVCVGIMIVSAVIVKTAHTSPGFDPYGWLDWGYQTIRLNLNLGGAPSWKPATFLFTVPYSLIGHDSYWLWMVTAAAFALAGPVVAGRIVFRLVRDSTGEAWPAIIGAIFAGAGLLGVYQYTHYWLSAQSDPMLATLFLFAIDMHLSRRPRWALTALLLCSLGRPETWAPMGLYVIWAWRAVPSMRKLIVAELILIPLFWFGVPVLSGNNWDVAGQLAQNSPRELHANKITGTLTRFRQLSYWPVEVLAVLGLVWAVVRRDWRVLLVCGSAAVWMAVEVAFAIHGFPGVPRYMFEAGAAMIVVSGVAVGWLLSAQPWKPLAARLGRSSGLARWLGAALAAAAVGFVIPDYAHQVNLERTDLTAQHARTTEIKLLHATIDALGGPAFIRSCGDPTVDVEYVSILAWYEHMNVGLVGHRPVFQITKQDVPIVLFTALRNGWIVHTYHLTPVQGIHCSSIETAFFVTDAQHPSGYVGRQIQ